MADGSKEGCRMVEFIIHQGDQYYLPFKIDIGGTMATPENVDDVRISVGGISGVYSKGTIKYTDGKWMLFVTKKATEKMFKSTVAQVEVRVGDSYTHSSPKIVSVGDSILKGEW